ncbi:MAG: NAD(+) synthase [Clostridiales Family XIII bacterium]|jgi:NAD+ synthase (glutamine-hydrolysing)|nr:NAD(+) synthase [Clostridiales Family XIII bacterium]
MSENKLGMLRAATISPRLRLADPQWNSREIASCVKAAAEKKAGLILLPELCISGYSCGDLFFQEQLYRSQLDALAFIMKETAHIESGIVLGAYLRLDGRLYNCALFLQGGAVIGAVPKRFLPNSKEFYEARWFAPGGRFDEPARTIDFMGSAIPFGNIIFSDAESGIAFGIELCEDLWAPVTPGALMAVSGATLIFNPSASNEGVGKPDYRRRLVLQSSASSICGYVYCSSGVGESTADLVFGGHGMIAENGILLAESPLFSRESVITFGDIDYERLLFERAQAHPMSDCASLLSGAASYTRVPVKPLRTLAAGDALMRSYHKTPFVPSDTGAVNERCDEIFSIQSAGLAERLERTGARKAVVGVSGGLDSTLALLACANALKLLGRPRLDLIAVTMPGFGTTRPTLTHALSLMRLLGADAREIPIGDAVTLHFRDIGHDPSVHDRTYENAQARERTQILMDIANRENGLVVGTGDLSEAALGWCTYNGDHMSMYGVNASIPKTLIRFVIQWVMDWKLSGAAEDIAFSSDNAALRETLAGILETPISPELLPPGKDGEIMQKTEEAIGPYVLHDFYLYYTLRFGMRPDKLSHIAAATFSGDYPKEETDKWLHVFYTRFFSQQFKRDCVPNGPKVGTVSLSPRGDWRMPSDASGRCWTER